MSISISIAERWQILYKVVHPTYLSVVFFHGHTLNMPVHTDKPFVTLSKWGYSIETMDSPAS